MRVFPWLAAAAIAGSAVLVPTSSWAADTPPPIEEDYAYPGADQILAQHGLKLFKGDGHILFVTSHKYGETQCAPGELQVEKVLDVDPFGVYYCFKTTGAKGWLTLEVQGTFGVRGGTKETQATATLPAGTKKFDIPPNVFVPIDPGTGSDTPQAVLVELR
ncbi:MAG: hypothetical protein QOC80_578, partial [Frankiaceae bacterium]|nr:hypothetical protein [Frankiaceae bacterium]